jgi:hypothetical protein
MLTAIEHIDRLVGRGGGVVEPLNVVRVPVVAPDEIEDRDGYVRRGVDGAEEVGRSRDAHDPVDERVARAPPAGSTTEPSNEAPIRTTFRAPVLRATRTAAARS